MLVGANTRLPNSAPNRRSTLASALDIFVRAEYSPRPLGFGECMKKLGMRLLVQQSSHGLQPAIYVCYQLNMFCRMDARRLVCAYVSFLAIGQISSGHLQAVLWSKRGPCLYRGWARRGP